jgi:hypothetical protein
MLLRLVFPVDWPDVLTPVPAYNFSENKEENAANAALSEVMTRAIDHWHRCLQWRKSLLGRTSL